jgi:hypothetical protein
MSGRENTRPIGSALATRISVRVTSDSRTSCAATPRNSPPTMTATNTPRKYSPIDGAGMARDI